MRHLLLCGLFFAVSCCGLHAQQSLPPGGQPPDAPSATAASAQVSAATGESKAATIAPQLAAIEDKLDAKQYDAAKPELLHYLEGHANDARANFDLGYLNEQTSQDEAAAAAYRKAITNDPRQFEARLALGLLLARQGDLAGAREQLQAATERQPAAPNPVAQGQAYRALAQLDLSTDPAAAKQSLLAALKVSAETVGDLLLTARIAAANGDVETEEAADRRLIAREPDSVEGLAGLAHILLKQKKYDEARPLLEMALKRIPDDPGLNMQMASLLAAEGKPEESIAELERLHTKLPADAHVTQMLADAYLAAHNAAQAEPLLVTLLKSQPANADLLDEEGQALIYEQKFAEADTVFRHASALNPRDVDAWNGLAYANSQLHQDAQTIAALTMRSKVVPETTTTLFLWAISYDNLHQAKLAAQYYQKFLESAKGKFPDQEWQAHHRLIALGQVH